MDDSGTLAERLAAARPRDDGIERRRLRAELGARLLDETLQPPQIGRYVVLRPIGTGAMGIVYAAFDPELDRKVAIKVLEPTAPRLANDRRRLLGEAQALAKLSDPNIVPVYDAGSVEDRVWIAMELVDGHTLRTWLEAGPRRWSEVAAVMLDAGRGLVAAHAAGLVHRDFKPENVMIGADRRVRVMDFGLACKVELDSNDHDDVASFAGTPAYMAAEQFDGCPADERTDQFAYCVTLWEALVGHHPFGIPRDGRVRPLPAGVRVPKWLLAVARRGLAQVPAERWPNMASLLRELERGQSRASQRRRLAWIGAGLCTAGLLAGAHELDAQRRASACEAEGDAVAEFWDESAREQLLAGLRASDVPHADGTARAVVEIFDARADEWRDVRVQACFDHDVHHHWEDDRLARSLWCLEDRRFEFAALARTLSRGERESANKARSAASRLSDAAHCGDAAALDRMPAIPAEHRDGIRSARERLAEADALYAAGSYAEGSLQSHELVAEADALGWPPLSAAARVMEASFLSMTAAYDEATTTATDAYFQAVRIPDWETAADAAITLVGIGVNRRDQDNGRLWGRHARVALEHADGLAGARAAALFHNLGLLHASAGEYDEARALHEQSQRIRAEIFGADDPESSAAALALASLDYETGNYAAARSALEQVVETRARSLGPEHPEVATALKNLAVVLQKTDDAAAALASMWRALAIEERSLGADHPRVAMTLNNLAISYNGAGDHAKARELHERSLAIREQHFGPDHPNVALSLDNLANVGENMGDLADATALRERALAIRERALGPDHPEVADSLNNLGVLLVRSGDRVRARALIERGLAIRESALGPRHPDVAVSLTNLAALEEDDARVVAIYRRILQIREAAFGPDHTEVARALTNLALEQELGEGDSVALLERALTIFDRHPGVQPREAAARFGLARALVNSGGDATRARALGEAALLAHRTDGATEQVARVERWLSARR